MAAYADLFDLATDDTWEKRLMVALWKASADVMQEADTVAQHATRMALAKKILTGGRQMPFNVICIIVMQNAAIFTNGANSTDAQIQTAVDNFFTTIANVEVKYGA